MAATPSTIRWSSEKGVKQIGLCVVVGLLIQASWSAPQGPSAAANPAAPLIPPPYVCRANYYVAKSGSDRNNGKSPASAWQTIGRAVTVLTSQGGPHGGVCVNVGDGEYEEAVRIVGLSGSGDRSDGYLVFRAEHRHRAKVQVPLAAARDAGAGAFRVEDSNFVVIDGFDLEGQIFPGSEEDGVVVSNDQSRKPPDAPVHHVKILNNLIHHHGGAGVGAVHADYLDVEGNEISDTSRTSIYEVSAISTWQGVASDQAPGFHNVVRDNIVFDNGEGDTGHATHTDGNGIIIDDFRNTQNGSTYGAYKPATLIENNLVYSNGGSGIHLFLSDHVTVRNNTTFDNMRDYNGLQTWRGEINVIKGDYDVFVNNIAVAVQEPNRWHAPNVSLMDNSYDGPNLGNVWRSNLSFNGTPGQPSTMTTGSGTVIDAAGGNLLGFDPKTRNLAAHDFTLTPRSPAIGAGTKVFGVPGYDLAGLKRIGPVDLGAYSSRAKFVGYVPRKPPLIIAPPDALAYVDNGL